MKSKSLYLVRPGVLEIREGTRPSPGPSQVLVQTIVSAISTGTEMLAYRGQLPGDSKFDAAIDRHTPKNTYPTKVGYAAVGRIVEIGKQVEADWLNRTVFAFRPHQEYFVAHPDEFVALPDGVDSDVATFIPNLETAVNLVMDARPMVGERVVIFGQGVVGLLVAAIVSRFPLGHLVTVDPIPLRRQVSSALGASDSLDPSSGEIARAIGRSLGIDIESDGADLTFELSGNPDALDIAVGVTGFGGRIIVGSWYGSKRAEIDLGGRFHRGRISITSSQVSTIGPDLSGRWDKRRRLDFVLSLLPELQLDALITHRFPIDQACDAFEFLDEAPAESVQVLLTYDE